MSTQDSPGDDPIRVLATHAAGRIRAVSLHIPDRAWMGGAVIGMAPAEGVEHPSTYRLMPSSSYGK